MSVRRRVYEHFVNPAGGRPPAGCGRPGDHADFAGHGEAPEAACAVPRPRTPPGIAVLCAPPDAAALGAGLALLLARRFRAPVVAVCAWTSLESSRPVWRAPGVPVARRLAAALAARGHHAQPAGRLAVVRLAARCEEAADEARRVIAAAGSAPVVVVLGGPRARAFDELLAEQDLVVVAMGRDADPAVARLALSGLASATVRACSCEVPATPSSRALAAAGLTLLPAARRALAGPTEEL